MPDYSDAKVEEITKMASQIIRNAKSNSVGSEVFDAIEAANLKSDQRQKVYCNLAEIISTDACKGLSPTTANTIMRGNTAGTEFMSSFTKVYAAEYIAAVEHQSLEAIKGIDLPAEGYTTSHQDPNIPNSPVTGNFDPTLSPDNVPKAGFRSDPEDVVINRLHMPAPLADQWDQVYEQAATAMVNASMNQMPKLSPEARNFYQASGAAVQAALPGEAGQKAATMVMVNNVVLRGASAQVKLDGASLKKNAQTDQDAILAKVMEESNNVAQSHFNMMPMQNVSEAGKAQNKIVNRVRANALEESREVFANLAQGMVPETPANELAPDNAAELLNEQIPGRKARFAPPQQADLQPAVAQPAVAPAELVAPAYNGPVITPPAGGPPLEAGQAQSQQAVQPEEGVEKKLSLASVRDALKQGLKKQGNELSLAQLRAEKPELIKEYQNLKNELADLKKEKPELKPDKFTSLAAALGDDDANKEFKHGENAAKIKELEQKLEKMRNDDPGLKQLERNKVGQVIHSKVRDAAKAVGNRLS